MTGGTGRTRAVRPPPGPDAGSHGGSDGRQRTVYVMREREGNPVRWLASLLAAGMLMVMAFAMGYAWPKEPPARAHALYLETVDQHVAGTDETYYLVRWVDAGAKSWNAYVTTEAARDRLIEWIGGRGE